MTKDGNYINEDICLKKKRKPQEATSFRLRNKVFIWIVLDFIFVLIAQYFSTYNFQFLFLSTVFLSFLVAVAINAIWFIVACLEGNMWYLSTLVDYSLMISQLLLVCIIYFFIF